MEVLGIEAETTRNNTVVSIDRHEVAPLTLTLIPLTEGMRLLPVTNHIMTIET